MAETNQPRKIIVHHTADPSNGNQFEKVNEYHKQRWNFASSIGFYAGYHYIIEKDGKVMRAREDDEEGAHTKMHNKESIGIGLAGNFDYQTPTANQTLALVKLIDSLVKKWQIPATEIYPHRKFAPTSCYGIVLLDDWAKNEYRSYLIANLIHIITILKAILEKILSYVSKKQ